MVLNLNKDTVIYNGEEVSYTSLPLNIQKCIPARSYCRINHIKDDFTISSISWYIHNGNNVKLSTIPKGTIEAIPAEYRPIWLCDNKVQGIEINLELGDTVVTSIGTFTSNDILSGQIELPYSQEIINYVERLVYANKPKIQQIGIDLYLLYNYKSHILVTLDELINRNPEIIKDYGLYYLVKNRNDFYINKNDYGMLVTQLETGEVCDFELKDLDTLTVFTDTDMFDLSLEDLFAGKCDRVNAKYLYYMKEYVKSFNMKCPKRNLRINNIIYTIRGNIVDNEYYKAQNMLDAPQELKDFFIKQGSAWNLQCKRSGGTTYLIGDTYITNCNTGVTTLKEG